jgi:hypothetical protein
MKSPDNNAKVSNFDGFVHPKTIRLSHGQFAFVVQTLNRARRNGPASMKPVQNQAPMRTQAVNDFLALRQLWGLL